MNLDYDNMLAQVKENIAKVEEEGRTETSLVFTSEKAASDFFYKMIDELDGWSIKACDSRSVPAHYVNNCALVKDDTDEEAQPSDV